MPISFNSPPRNLFLLGSSGEGIVTNFFKSIDQSAGTDGTYIPSQIKYNYADQKFLLSGSASDSNSKGFGWFEKRDYAGTSSTSEWDVRVEASASVNTTLRAMELDSGNNLIVVGKTGAVPWIAKYSNAGVLDWQSTTNTGDLEYTGITSDSNGNYYACGSTPESGEALAFVEKFDASGNPSWGKSAFMLGRDVVLEKISANSKGEVVAVGYLEDDSADKGYIIKIDSNTGEVIWDRTLERSISGTGGGISPDDIEPADVKCTACYIDSNDQIYVVGSIDGSVPIDNGVGEFLIKYSPEGNIMWQRERDTNHYTILDGAPNTIPFDVKSDGETEQTVVLSVEDQGFFALNNSDIFISKYSKNGNLVFRRKISKGNDNLGAASLDADPSFYYLLFRDEQIDGLVGEPDRYTFGKVSSSGNGLGAFQYNDGTGTGIDYTAESNPQNKIGRLSDGSVRNDTSDLITYPFTANKILFDDFATQVSNKKRQMDDADSFEYSGSPAIRPADFQELNLLGDNVSDRIWNDTSGKGNNGVASLTEPFFGAGSTSFDGTGDSISVGPLLPTSTGTAFTVDMFWRSTSNTVQTCLWEQHNSGSGRTAYFINGTNAFLISEGNTVGNFAYSDNVWYFTRVTYTAGGEIEVFVDGVSRGIGTQTVGVDNVNFVIGDRSGANESFNGYISNCRVVVGSALNGTQETEVPTSPLTAISGTELLTCQGDTIADASPNNFTITVNGNAAPTDDGPTHNAAGYWEFDGVDDYIDFTNPGLTNEFSLEAWVRPTNFPANNAEDNGIFGTSTTSPRSQFDFNEGPTPGTNTNLRFYDSGLNPPGLESTLNVSDVVNKWSHVAVTRSGTTTTIYLNGSVLISGTQTGSSNSNSITKIGTAAVGGPQYFEGDIGQSRIYPRTLTAAQVFQNYNATKETYTGVAASTDPGLTSTRTP